MLPSSAVTTTGIVLAPTLSVLNPEALPVMTGVPFTVMVAVVSVTVGVTAILPTAATVAV